MKLGMLITSIGNFGKKGFYNSQEIGLAKELDKLFDEVILYKAVPITEEKNESKIEGCSHTIFHQVPVKSQGINGMWDCSVMDKTIDALLFFSDTQLCVPDVFKWCNDNNISLYPYVGVIESHSSNKIKKFIINQMFKKNLNVYKKCTCFVKTPTVQKALNDKGVNNCVVAPVGLDISLMKHDYADADETELKEKYGYKKEDKVILFIGRLTAEKQPIKMLEIFEKVYGTDKAFKLLMIGKGELKESVETKANEINKKAEERVVQLIEQIPNKDIWELYRIADCFVNLNQQEIFGMAILEAMYYGCKVVAMHAPGPDFIIENYISGYLVSNVENTIQIIQEKNENISTNAHKRIKNTFMWETTAKKIDSVINKD